MQTYTGGCQCGAVKYEVTTDIPEVLECNCSHCSKKGFLLHFVKPEDFKLISGKDAQTEYFFNKKAIRHLFCKTCGVQSYSEGVTFPGMAINVRCLENFDHSSLPRKAYNGKDM